MGSKTLLQWIVLGTLFSVLGGCGSVHHSRWEGNRVSYTVSKGETLYSIAERYGYDHREVASWNRIRYPYRIYPGQRLTLIAPNRRYYTVRRGETLYSIAWRYGYDYREVARWNGINSPYNIYPGQRLVFGIPGKSSGSVRESSSSKIAKKSSSTKTVPRKKSSSSSKSLEKRKTSRHQRKVTWQWPSQGIIVSSFNPSKGKKGLDIRGKLGQSVQAAADGNVVYSGSGLIGYGNLVIIKHNDTYLSAYGHNRKLLVKEGTSVKQGEKIAEMGDSGKDGVILHFEVRRDGKPVNPLAYLPKRK